MRARLLSCIVLFVLLSGCNQESAEVFDMAVENGNVIDLETGKISLRHILISEGRIKKLIDPDAGLSFEAKQTVDATGKFILPGFWDNHVHFRGGDSLISANKNFLKLFIANGITTVRDAGGDLTPSVMAWKDAIKRDLLIGPTIFTSGPKIDGPDATWAGSLEVENDTEIAEALDSLERIPVDFVKLYDSRISGENYLKTIREAEKRGLITSGHMPFTVTLDETVEAGIDAIEHLYYVMKGCSANETEVTEKMESGEIGFWDAMPLLLESYADSTAQNTFASLKKHDVFVVPTLHIGETLSYLDEADHTNDPYLNYMGDGIVETYQGRIKSALNASAQAKSDRKKLQAFFGELAKSLNEAGVKLLAGSDSGAYNSYVYPGVSLHRELEEMVKSGISPLDALRTSATNGSEFLKKEADYGSIAVGQISDLVILEENPLQDIANTQKIHTVLKGRTIYDKKQLQELLDSAVME